MAGEGKEVCIVGVGKSPILMSWALEIMTRHRGINRLKFLRTRLFVYPFGNYLPNIHFVPIVPSSFIRLWEYSGEQNRTPVLMEFVPYRETHK